MIERRPERRLGEILMIKNLFFESRQFIAEKQTIYCRKADNLLQKSRQFIAEKQTIYCN